MLGAMSINSPRNGKVESQAQGPPRTGDRTGGKAIMYLEGPSRRQDWRPAHLQQSSGLGCQSQADTELLHWGRGCVGAPREDGPSQGLWVLPGL